MAEIGITEQREHWNTKTVFIFASIGSAIGLGNIWRFPRICAENGGAAFLIAYVVALFTTGIPILILELAMGRKMQTATPGCFKKVNKKFEWIGWCIVGVGFMITTYYAVIMSWGFNYFVFSFNQSWGDMPSAFFTKSFLMVSKASELPGGWGNLSIPILIGTIISWIAIMACIWKGVTTVSKVVYYTVAIPWILLIIFVIRGVTLPGAMEGLKYYLMIGKDSAPYLFKAKTWLNAFTQVFFSLSIGFGIMFAYGSFMDTRTKIVRSAFIIGIFDSLTAIVGGLAVFSALGYLSTPEHGNIPIQDWMGSSLGICFIAYPILINNIFAGFIFGPLFFLMLLTLAIDSAFSLVEAVVTPIEDKFKWKHRKALYIVCGLGLILGLPHMFQSGLYWFDILDNFMNQFGLAVACLMECIVFGYIYKTSRIRRELAETGDHIGRWWDFMIKFICPVAILLLVINEVVERIKKPYEGYPRIAEFLGGWLALILIVSAAICLTLVRARNKDQKD